jgi:hypothetical protein
LFTPGNPVVTGTTIASSWANNTLNDIATGLSTAVLKDGTQTITANIPMASFRITGLGNATARTDAITAAQVQDSTTLFAAGAAGTNTVTVSCTPAITAYVTGQRFWVIPAGTNTGATTINVNGVGAKNAFWNGAALTGGEMKQNVPVDVAYDGTQFNLMGPQISGSETARTAAYQWTTWNPSDVAGTATNAPATAVATSTATNFMTMANSSGTVTYTFTKAGNYLITVLVECDSAAAASSLRCLVTLGGTATRLVTGTGQAGQGNTAAQNQEYALTFLVNATASQTLTVLPRGQVTSGGVAGNFTFSANATATYVGV